MFLGLRTTIYQVDDVVKARSWYSSILGFGPYFDQPFYVGFNVGGYELGLQPGGTNTADKADGVVAYWGVEHAEAAGATDGRGAFEIVVPPGKYHVDVFPPIRVVAGWATPASQ